MKIEILKGKITRDKVEHSTGSIIDLGNAEAESLIALGFAKKAADGAETAPAPEETADAGLEDFAPNKPKPKGKGAPE